MAPKLKRLFSSVNPTVVKAVVQTAMGIGAVNDWLPRTTEALMSKLLKKFPGYTGSVGSINFRFTTGRIEILNFALNKKITREYSESFIVVPRISIGLRWTQLLHKHVIARIEVQEPAIVFNAQRWKAERVPRPDPERRHDFASTWQGKLSKAMAFKIESFVIRNGTVRVSQLTPDAGEIIEFHALNMRVRDFSNRAELSRGLLANTEGACRVNTHAHFEWAAEGELLDPRPSFSGSLKLKDFPLKSVQGLVRHYFDVELEQGIFELYAEAEARDGKFKGYAKPIFDHLHLRPVRRPGLWKRFKTLVYQGMVRLLRNKYAERIATRVNFEGTFEHLQVDLAAIVGNFAKNAFGSAIKARLDSSLLHFLWRRNDSNETPLDSKPGRWHRWSGYLKESFSRWMEHEVPRMAASLSYYTCFSLAPLLLLVIAVIGLVFGQDAARGHILRQLSGLVGQQSAEVIQTMIAAAWQPSKGITAAIVSIATLVVGAFGVLSELKVGLNRVMKTSEPGGIGQIVKDRAKFIGLILGIGFLLLVSLAVSAFVSALGQWLIQMLPFHQVVLHAIDLGLSIGVVTVLFAMMFHYLPNSRLPWKSVWYGSLFTAVLFTAGKAGLGLYLGRSSTASSYGAAGSILVVLLWVYYSALILYYGAEFTKVYSEKGKTAHG